MRIRKKLKLKTIGLFACMLVTMTGFHTMTAMATAATAAEAVIPENVHITSCKITGRDQITVTGTSNGTYSGADNNFYLVELKPYQDSLDGRTDYTAMATKSTSLNFQFSLDDNTENSKLYSKFVVAVWDGQKYHAVSNPAYITNPEYLAKNTTEFRDPLTKKGLLIENAMLADAFELGVKHVIVNIPFHHILGEGISYTYEGKKYSFNKKLMEEYDETVSRMSEKGMLVTAVILNGWNPSTPQLIYPGVKQNSQAFYYGFNASTEQGYEDIRAIASFLASRYDGTNPNQGKISNWIIGNEINNNGNWNYMGKMEIQPYVREYERAFRVFYTAIKSTNKNDRLYFSLDYDWNFKDANQLKYSGKGVVDVFNAYIKEGGQIDWGLAYHPYSIPLTEPEFWDDDQTGLIKNDPSSPVINFKNLDVLTDYFKQDNLRTASGDVRHIILSEQGFTARSATRGTIDTNLQAAAFAYAYYIADSNPYIDAFIMSRQVDAVSEANQSLMFGLWACDMNSPNVVKATQRRKIWSVFKGIDKKDSLEVTEFAKSVLGISKWKDVIPNFNRNEN